MARKSMREPKPMKLSDVLSNFHTRLAYRSKDLKALNMSRKAAAGALSDSDYAEWAAINNDPLVSINYVKTFITLLSDQMSMHPCRPKNDRLFAMGEVIKLNQKVDEGFTDTLNDGYSYYGVGVKNARPQVQKIDARYILHDGTDPTLLDTKNAIVFQIKPLTFAESNSPEYCSNDCAIEYVTYDSSIERVVVSYYHEENGVWYLDVYDKDDDNPERVVLKNINRCPIVRFTGDPVELSDERFHYRGLYYTFGSLQKAMQLAATKVQVRTATEDDANYVADTKSIDTRRESWSGVGVREWKSSDINGAKYEKPIQIIHDNQFLINCVNLWKGVISDMLGPVVQSGSDAVTRDEVQARNMIRDAITHKYVIPAMNAISEIYRLIGMFIDGTDMEVVMVGGILENVKRQKEKSELEFAYQKAKEAGMNTTPIVNQMVSILDLEANVKEALIQGMAVDPNASPVVVQLKQQLQQLQQLNQRKDFQIALLKAQATNRMERQSEYTASVERMKRLGYQVDQWKTEQDQTQEARMAVLNAAIESGNMELAMQILQEIEQQQPPLQASPVVDRMTDQYTDEIRNLGNNPDVQAAFNDPQIAQQAAQNVTQEGAVALQQQQIRNAQMQQALQRRRMEQMQRQGILPQNVVQLPQNRGV